MIAVTGPIHTLDPPKTRNVRREEQMKPWVFQGHGDRFRESLRVEGELKRISWGGFGAEVIFVKDGTLEVSEEWPIVMVWLDD